jgi:hypothetical protein
VDTSVGRFVGVLGGVLWGVLGRLRSVKNKLHRAFSASSITPRVVSPFDGANVHMVAVDFWGVVGAILYAEMKDDGE